ncbi:MAG: phosphoenolpyruvate carboxykinase (ATP) [Elusimicrobiales bacterium]|nr:phosphoenolpyruvate carboxykinase (ATP) [Elusimicrobiales bacterium]HOJ86250.1 phosphoenolpyruvate carboxykinase (ATP) [Elusimicrobiales bacterium]HPO95377.1 phosphoenolpyruvate carboxykinase (ATP) [Elusimicrobiales bacterium]
MISSLKKNHIDLTEAELYEHIIKNDEGVILNTGAISVKTGKHTARSAQDKFIVKKSPSEKHIWWGDNNVAIDEKVFLNLYEKVKKYIASKDFIYVRNSYIGSNPNFRLKTRVITEFAWHSLFVKNLFFDYGSKLSESDADFTIISVPNFKADPKIDGTRSETFIIISFEHKTAIIGGTGYAGEIKKTAFSVMNYLLPLKNVFPMHCSANISKEGETAIFFGLSGTGKTTLSSDPERRLIGDDEHGWGDDGIFNFEAGCYAKVINLSKEAEPQIYSAVNRFQSVLENVVYDKNRMPVFEDGSLTENTRCGYPLRFIDNAIYGEKFPHPKNIIMLAYDAFGVLPPIAKLNHSQAMYHFISGYTAKVANTEIGIKEPKATFSTCFGAPFMSHHPSVYANMLSDKMKKYDSNCWLINTGLCGGPYGVGKRISIKLTREILKFALEYKNEKIEFIKDPIFGFEIPQIPSIDKSLLNPKLSWKNPSDYDLKYKELAAMFIKNFGKFGISELEIINGGPKI